jgi:hypothetical protein
LSLQRGGVCDAATSRLYGASGAALRRRFDPTGRRKNPVAAMINTPQRELRDYISDNMKTLIEYIIVAVPFHADAATHEELARKVNEKLNAGYELHGSPFLSEEMMYQALTKPILQTLPLPAK